MATSFSFSFFEPEDLSEEAEFDEEVEVSLVGVVEME